MIHYTPQDGEAELDALLRCTNRESKQITLAFLLNERASSIARLAHEFSLIAPNVFADTRRALADMLDTFFVPHDFAVCTQESAQREYALTAKGVSIGRQTALFSLVYAASHATSLFSILGAEHTRSQRAGPYHRFRMIEELDDAGIQTVRDLEDTLKTPHATLLFSCSQLERQRLVEIQSSSPSALKASTSLRLLAKGQRFRNDYCRPLREALLTRSGQVFDVWEQFMVEPKKFFECARIGAQLYTGASTALNRIPRTTHLAQLKGYLSSATRAAPRKLAEVLGVKKSYLHGLLNELLESEEIERFSEGKNAFYTLKQS